MQLKNNSDKRFWEIILYSNIRLNKQVRSNLYCFGLVCFHLHWYVFDDNVMMYFVCDQKNPWYLHVQEHLLRKDILFNWVFRELFSWEIKEDKLFVLSCFDYSKYFLDHFVLSFFVVWFDGVYKTTRKMSFQ